MDPPEIPPAPITPSWNHGKLAAIRGIEDGVLRDRSGEVHTWMNPDQPREWASCGRAGISMTTWMHLATHDPVMRAALDRSIHDLGTPTALRFPAHQRLADVLAYIQPNGRWAYSYGWREMDDVFFEVTGQRIHDYYNQHVDPLLSGGMRARENRDDGTPRVVGSPRDAIMWAEMMLADGGGILAPDLVARVLGGGPDGTGVPFALEGMQVHLIRGGVAWELSLPGVPNGFMARDGNKSTEHGHGIFAAFPSCGVTFAYRGGTPARVLPKLFEAMT